MGHWYDKDAKPRHYEGKNGGDTTLREARKLGLYPSVTTIGSILHKEGLVYWLQEQAAIAAAEKCNSVEGMVLPDKAWTAEVIAAAKAKTAEKADAGTEIHDKLEKFQADPFSLSHEDQVMCMAIAKCIKDNTGLSLYTDFIPEKTFCNTLRGYAGTCDLHTKPEVKTPWVLDYKTKDEVNEKTKGYSEQGEQLVAYSHGLGISNARVGNIFISRKPPEGDEPWGVVFYEHKDTIMAWENFRHTLQAWQVRNKYGPYYDELKKQLTGESDG